MKVKLIILPDRKSQIINFTYEKKIMEKVSIKLKKLCERCNEYLNIDNFCYHKKKNSWFIYCKNCFNEKVKCLLCKKYIRKNSLTQKKNDITTVWWNQNTMLSITMPITILMTTRISITITISITLVLTERW